MLRPIRLSTRLLQWPQRPQRLLRTKTAVTAAATRPASPFQNPPDAFRLQARHCSCSSSSPDAAANNSNGSTEPEAQPGPAAADHRDLGTAQKLFLSSPHSPGSPLFLPHGAELFNKLVGFLRAQYPAWGFEEVITPIIYKPDLWKQSGHWENYADDMFLVNDGADSSPAEASPSSSSPSPSFGLKPMNCPGHCLIFDSEPRSWRDLPIRYADFGPLHRNEASGALVGLTRVRRFHQDDGHVFCTPAQIEAEIGRALAATAQVYRAVFGAAADFDLVLSTRPDPSIGDAAEWDAAEAQLRAALDRTGRPWRVRPGEGAFYGPKIDVLVRDALGRTHQTGTVQLDFQLPQRFGLKYQAEPEADTAGSASTTTSSSYSSSSSSSSTTGQPRTGTPVLIHRAILGSLERFLALTIESFAGRYPFWLSPRPAAVATVSSDPRLVAYGEHVRAVLAGVLPRHAVFAPAGPDASPASPAAIPPLRPATAPPVLTVSLDPSARPLGAKVRAALAQRPAFVAVVGQRDAEAGTVRVRVGTGLRDGWAAAVGEGGEGEVEETKKAEDEVGQLMRALAERGQADATPALVRAMFERMLEEWR